MTMRVTVPAAELVLIESRGAKARAQWEALLAKVCQKGAVLELITAVAWSRALGYSVGELNGKPLRELLVQHGAAASEVIAALADEQCEQLLEIELRCKDGRRKAFRLHRCRDDYDGAIFLLAEELPVARSEGSSRSYSLRTTA